MYSPKDQIRAQLDGADEHLASLEAALRSYSAKACRIVREDDLEVGKASYRLREVTQPPIVCARLVSDIANNLRAPLDYIVTNLAENSRIQAKGEPAFPICTTEAKWNESLRRLARVHPSDRDAIMEIQPFKQYGGLNPEDHPLAALNSLSNFYKHRVLVVVKAIGAEKIRHRAKLGGTVKALSFRQAPFEDGAEIAVLVPSKTDRGGWVSSSDGEAGVGDDLNFVVRDDFVEGEDMGEYILRQAALGNAGEGPWTRAEWDAHLRDTDLDIQVSFAVEFGPGVGPDPGRTEGLPVLETIYGIRRYLDNNAFQKGGLIERLV